MSASAEVMVAGHICLDVLPDLGGAGREPFADSFVPGHLIAAGPVSYAPGGAVSNTGLALKRLGISTRLVGKMGDDLFGQALSQIVGSFGQDLTTHLRVDASTHTSYSIIISYPATDRIFVHYPGANDTFQAADIPADSLPELRLFHFGYPPLMRSTYLGEGAELQAIFRLAKGSDLTTSLDMAFPDPESEAAGANWTAILGSVLPLVDIFLPSVEEILFVLRPWTYTDMREAAAGGDILPLITPQLLSDLARELLVMGARMVILKLGHRGLYLRTAGEDALRDMGRGRPTSPGQWAEKELWVPCFLVQVAGSTGSGDATIAGFLAGLLRGLPAEEALTFAVAVGACNVERLDALSGIRTWDETSRRIRAGWERQPLELHASGWRFDTGCALWRGPCDS